MKLMKKIMILTAVMVMVFSLFALSASAKTSQLYNENFSSYSDGEFPDSLMTLSPAPIQEVQKKSFVIENDTMNFSTHGALFAIDPATTRLSLSCKVKVSGGIVTLIGFGTTEKAMQVQFLQGTLMASYGGPHELMPVGSYSDDVWIRVLSKIDFDSSTYDLEIDDVLVAEGLPLSDITPEDLPLPFMVGAYGENQAVVLDNIIVKGNVPSGNKKEIVPASDALGSFMKPDWITE